MDFRLTEAEENWRRELREFFRKEVTPELLEDLRRRKESHSPELYAKMAQKGWLGLTWPKEYGGQGRSQIEMTILNEEMEYAGVPRETINVYGNSVVHLGGCLLAFSSEEQKMKWLPLIARGELRNCLGWTEPGAGCDSASVQTRGVEDGDDFILTGTKHFNNAYYANHMIATTRTDPNVPKHRGITLFLIPLDRPGITITPQWTIGGIRRNEVHLEAVRVPRTHLLGEKNRGWYHLLTSLNLQRGGGHGASELRRELDELIALVKEKRRHGQPLYQIPAVRYALAELAAEVETARLLLYRVAWMQSRGIIPTYEASVSKLYTSELKERFSSRALDILGRYGELESWGAEKKWVPLEGRIPLMYRDCRTGQIAGGTSEIQRNIIAIRGLGLPH